MKKDNIKVENAIAFDINHLILSSLVSLKNLSLLISIVEYCATLKHIIFVFFIDYIFLILQK